MTHKTWLQKKKCFLVERHKSGCCLSNPSSKHAWNTQQTSNPVEGLRKNPRVFSATGLCKTFFAPAASFLGIYHGFQARVAPDIASPVTFDHFPQIHQEAVCGNATGGFSVLALGGRRQLLFPCALLKALESWLGRPKILRSSRSWSLCRAQSLSWKWAGEWCGNQAGEETPSSNICSRCLETALGSSGLRPLRISDAGRSIPFAMLYRIRPPGAFPILQELSFMRNLWANSKNLNLVHSEENVCTILLNYILSLRSEAAAHESPAGSVHQI